MRASYAPAVLLQPFRQRLIQGFGEVVEPFAGGGLVVEVKQVELFEQQQGLSADELCHVEGGGFLSGHGDFSGMGDQNGLKPGVMRFRA